MNTRRILLSVALTLGLIATSLNATQANAAILDIRDDMCTVGISDADQAHGRTIMLEWHSNITQGVKDALPHVTEDIDFLLENVDPGVIPVPEIARQLGISKERVDNAGTDKGFFPTEAGALVIAEVVFAKSTTELFYPVTFHKGSTPKFSSAFDMPDDSMGPISPRAKQIINDAFPTSGAAIDRWYQALHTACADNRPGTYNLTPPQSGGNEDDKRQGSGGSSSSS